MKFFLCIFTICFIFSKNVLGYKLRGETETDYILKLNENYYNKIGHERIDEFKNMVFRELDQKTEIWDKNLKSIETEKRTNKIPMNRTITHNEFQKNNYDGFKAFAGEYTTNERIIKFYISHSQECSIFINDTVSYENLNNVNFVEHMILHNNADNIDPKGVYSDQININFFAFNKKLNIFSVYFDPKNKNNIKTSNENIHKKNFTVEYDYDALNIIKSNFIKENEINQHNSTNNNVINYNSFIWKILNQNFLKTKENITLEMYFDVGKEFQHEEVEFSLNFTKSIIDDEKKTIVKYEWKGVIEPQEVIVLQAKFPLYFEHCGNLSINLVMIFVGSVFIVFLIGMLYIILSTVFSEDIL